MNRLLLLILIAGVTFLIVLFAIKPELIEQIWLWVIGLAGPIIKAIQEIGNFFKRKFKGSKDSPDNNALNDVDKRSRQANNAEASLPFNGISLLLTRFSDNGQTTLGLLSVQQRFFGYTFEETYREIKEQGKTRVPAGTYSVAFRQEETDLTKAYRQRYPDWFTWHLELLQVPGFDSVYIHIGGDHTNTEGCLLVSDSLDVSDEVTFLSNSRITFQRLYSYLKEQLSQRVPIRITIHDENWINQLN